MTIVAVLPPRTHTFIRSISCEIPEPDDARGVQEFREFNELAQELGVLGYFREER
jgi:hypothetical protein